MNKILRKIALLSLMLVSMTAFGQGVKDIRINEIMVNNESSYQDDYGNRVGWIELHNTGYSNVNISGCRLVLTSGGEKVSYTIPKNDPATILAPQGYVVFFTDGTSTKGTFYTNFRLEDGNSIAFMDQSTGIEPLDAMDYDQNMRADVSKGWMMNEAAELAVVENLPSTTPKASNETIMFASRADSFREHDPNGIAMALTAMSVVFTSLVFLFFVFKFIGKAFSAPAKKSSAAAVSGAPEAVADASTEVVAAIAVALTRYNEAMQDEEANVITINHVGKVYSPWSSKIYGMRQLPEKR